MAATDQALDLRTDAALRKLPRSEWKTWLRAQLREALVGPPADGDDAILSENRPWTRRERRFLWLLNRYRESGFDPRDADDAAFLGTLRAHVGDHDIPTSLASLNYVTYFDPRPEDAQAVLSWFSSEPSPTVRAAIAVAASQQGMGTMIDTMSAWLARETSTAVQVAILNGTERMLGRNEQRSINVGKAIPPDEAKDLLQRLRSGEKLSGRLDVRGQAEEYWRYDAMALLGAASSVGASTSDVSVVYDVEALARALKPSVPAAADVAEQMNARAQAMEQPSTMPR